MGNCFKLLYDNLFIKFYLVSTLYSIVSTRIIIFIVPYKKSKIEYL